MSLEGIILLRAALRYAPQSVIMQVQLLQALEVHLVNHLSSTKLQEEKHSHFILALSEAPLLVPDPTLIEVPCKFPLQKRTREELNGSEA